MATWRGYGERIFGNEGVSSTQRINEVMLSGSEYRWPNYFGLTDSELYVDISTWFFGEDVYMQLKSSGIRSSILAVIGEMADEREFLGFENRGGLINIINGKCL